MTGSNWLSRTARRLSGTQAPAAEAEATPCIPCGQKKGVRQFSLNVPETMIEESEIPALAPDVAFTIVDDSVVLYQTTAGTSHVLNPTAALIWATVGDGLTVGAIIDELAQTAGVERSVITRDVRTTLSQFAAAGIVVPVEPQPPAPSAAPPTISSAPQDHGDHEWTATFGPVLAASAPVTVQTDSDEVAALLDPLLEALPRSSKAHDATNISIAVRSSGTEPYRLHVDGARQSAWASTAEVTSALQVELNRIATETPAGRLVLHAGAVERDGDVIVIAGDSGQGKSTLTARLVQRGYGYLTDEIAAVDHRDLDVRPYPKAISLDATALDLLGVRQAEETSGKAHVAAERFGRVSSGGTARMIVILSEEPLKEGGEPMAAGVARLLGLLSCTFLSTFEDPEALDALNDLATRVPVVRLSRGDLDEACDRIDAQFVALSRAVRA